MEQRAGWGGDKNKEYCEERRRWEKRRFGRMRGGREGCRRRKGRLGIQEVVWVRMEWKGQRKGQKRDMQRHREEMLEKTRGRAMGEDAKKGSKILRQKEGKRDRDQEVGRQGKCGRTGERGREVGDVTGASGWQGWAGWGRKLGRRLVTCGPSPHCWVRRSEKS